MALKTDLVSYYSFDVDASDDHGSNDGTVSGATHTSSGKLDDAYDFDGTNDYISLGNPSNLSFSSSDAFSISVWFKSGSNTYLPIIWKGYYSYAGDTKYMEINSSYADNKVNVFVRHDYNSKSLTSSSTYNDSSWHHLVVTYDNGSMELFIDGSSEGTVSSVDYQSTTQNWEIGRRNAGSQYSDNIIDELAIWSRAITSSEVSEIYNSGSGLAYTSWDAATGWTGKINGVTNPAKINGITVASISKVNGI